jgi:hypothetical protein
MAPGPPDRSRSHIEEVITRVLVSLWLVANAAVGWIYGSATVWYRVHDHRVLNARTIAGGLCAVLLPATTIWFIANAPWKRLLVWIGLAVQCVFAVTLYFYERVSPHGGECFLIAIFVEIVPLAVIVQKVGAPRGRSGPVDPRTAHDGLASGPFTGGGSADG